MAVYLINRSPTSALSEDILPAEMWYGVKPNLNKIKVFGCVAFVHKPKVQQHGKFDSRSKKCVFLGYTVNGYRLWSFTENKIIIAHDVIFVETKRVTSVSGSSEYFKEQNLQERGSNADIDRRGEEDNFSDEVQEGNVEENSEVDTDQELEGQTIGREMNQNKI
jgi:hypothetical protein